MLNKAVAIFIISCVATPFVTIFAVMFHIVMFVGRRIMHHRAATAGQPSRSQRKAYRKHLLAIEERLVAEGTAA